jgi:glycosyltransferase involved in cell wall biosynthesis
MKALEIPRGEVRPYGWIAREMARQRLVSDGRPMLLFVGRLDAIKDLDLLLASVARMRTDDGRSHQRLDRA